MELLLNGPRMEHATFQWRSLEPWWDAESTINVSRNVQPRGPDSMVSTLTCTPIKSMCLVERRNIAARDLDANHSSHSCKFGGDVREV